MDKDKKIIIKFHGTEVRNVIILYATRPISDTMEEFDAGKVRESCETINVQVVADFVTITLYSQESTNSIIRRELIPVHKVDHIWITH
jgi:predicted transcriptional regulator